MGIGLILFLVPNSLTNIGLNNQSIPINHTPLTIDTFFNHPQIIHLNPKHSPTLNTKHNLRINRKHNLRINRKHNLRINRKHSLRIKRRLNPKVLRDKVVLDLDLGKEEAADKVKHYMNSLKHLTNNLK